MKEPRIEMPYSDWRRDVDERLLKIYCITEIERNTFWFC